MMQEFKQIGEAILKDSTDKREILTHLSYEPNLQGKDSLNHPIIINLDTKNKKIEFDYAKYDPKTVREEFCFLSSPANEGKVYFNTNNLSNHIKRTIPDLIKKIEEYQQASNIQEKEMIEFKKFLQHIKKKFYNSPKGLLNFDLVKTKNSAEKEVKESNFETLFEEAIMESRDINLKKKIKDHNAFCLYTDNKNIFKTKYAKVYREILYYDKIGYLFDVDSPTTTCHMCSQNKKVSKNLKFPFKVFMLDKVGFFNRGNKKEAYKSYSLCEECFKKIICGIKFVSDELRFYFLKQNIFLIPKSEQFYKKIVHNTDILKDEMRAQLGMIGWKEFEKLSKEKYYHNSIFDVLFFFHPKGSQQYKIKRSISDIAASKMAKISKLLKEESRNDYNIFENGESLNINFYELGRVLFSNNQFGDDEKARLMLDYLDAIYKNITIDNESYFDQYLKNYKKEFYDEKFSTLYKLSFQSFMLINFFRKNGNWEDEIMNLNMSTKVENKDLIEFFEQHQNLDNLKKGLITFGYYINKIVYQQKNKSSTFLNKIQFSGMDKRDLQELVLDFQEYLKLYEGKKDKKGIFEEPAEKAFAIEAITGYINSEEEISPQEVSYYILFGTNLGRYIGKKYSKEDDKK